MFSDAIIKVISWNNIPIYDGRKIASILDNCNSFKDVGIFYKTILDFIDNSYITNYDLCKKSFENLLARSVCS